MEDTATWTPTAVFDPASLEIGSDSLHASRERPGRTETCVPPPQEPRPTPDRSRGLGQRLSLGVADSLFGEAACDHAGDGDELVGAVWTWALLGLRDTGSASGRVARPERRTGCDANGRVRPARCVPCGERWQRHRSPLADRSDASRVTRSISPGALDWRVAQPKPPGRFRLASGSIDGRSR